MDARDDAITEAKRRVRQTIRARRRDRTAEERTAAANRLSERLVTLVNMSGAHTVAAYLSSPSEPGTEPFLTWARQNAIRVLLPLSKPDGLLDWADEHHGSRMGDLGVPEPIGTALGPDALAQADLIIAPASAVDCQGFRLGWGRGYYDKSLAAAGGTSPVYALLFDDEVLPEVPREVHDRPVTGAVTPDRILDF